MTAWREWDNSSPGATGSSGRSVPAGWEGCGSPPTRCLGRPVAIKNCSAPDGLSEDERELLRGWTLREAQAAGRVSHPNVIGIYDVLPGEDQPWIVMEYVPSRSLMQLIKDVGPLPVERVAGIGLALLGALDAAEPRGCPSPGRQAEQRAHCATTVVWCSPTSAPP